MFSYRRQREATWEYRSKLLLINFPMFSHRRQREATGGNGNKKQNKIKIKLNRYHKKRVASRCPPSLGIPLKIAFNKFPHVFLPDATGGNMGIPLKFLISFPMLSYRRQREATGIPLELTRLI